MWVIGLVVTSIITYIYTYVQKGTLATGWYLAGDVEEAAVLEMCITAPTLLNSTANAMEMA